MEINHLSYKSVRFNELFEIPLRNGVTKPKRIRGRGIKMVNMGELFSHSRIINRDMDRVPMSIGEKKDYLLQPGDLLFARQSLVLSGAGKCSIFIQDNEEVTFESHIIRARLNKSKANPFFYYYYFNSPQGKSNISQIIEQVAAAGIRGKDLENLEIPYPHISDQNKIVEKLFLIDEKIELNRQMNQTLEAMARAIFKSWFVDFDPVYAKMEGRDYPLPPEIMDLFPDELEESELGLIPKGWRVIEVNELVNRISLAKRYRKELALESGKIPIYEQGNNLLMGFHNDEPDLFAQIDKPYFIFGDHTCVMELIIEPFSLGPNVIPLEGKNVPTIWAYYSTLRKQKFEEYRRHWMELIIKKTIISDNNSILNSFVDSVNPIIQKININKNQIFNLEIIKKLLLPKLMSGELEL